MHDQGFALESWAYISIIGNITKKDNPHVQHDLNKFVLVVDIHIPDNDPIGWNIGLW